MASSHCPGSPPRMRGIHHAGHLGRTELGITPAHAGNTNESGVYSLVFGDHPRACGEYRSLRGQRMHGTGSPPRMRGIRAVARKSFAAAGITPAHAGNTILNLDRGNTAEDHPRACGEYI